MRELLGGKGANLAEMTNIGLPVPQGFTITTEEMCIRDRSRSYISHMFKSRCGVTIRAYCNRLKLEDAKNLLGKTDLPITEIALNVGFGDVSYFIRLFRERFSMTPLQYRKECR